MPPVLLIWLAALLCTVPEQGAVVHDTVVAQYNEAVSAARAEGLLSLVARLDATAAAFPGSRFTPTLQQLIQVIGLLHPGSVPDRAARLQRLKEQASTGNAEAAAAVTRIEILANYFASAARGRPEEGEPLLRQTALGDVPFALQARADAAFRTGDLSRSRALTQAAIEADPFSPVLAPSYVLLALCDASQGNRASAARNLHRALAISPLPTVYGRTQDYTSLLSRFVRPVPGPVGGIYDESVATRIAGGNEIKDPRSLVFAGGRFTLLDREQMLTISPDAKVLANRQVRDMQDVAITAAGAGCFVAEDSVDLGSGTLARLSVVLGGKKKTLEQMRSIALDARGEAYILDADSGIFRVSPGPTPSGVLISGIRGRQLRIDGRGRMYVVGTDEKTIQVLSHEGKPVAAVVPGGTKQSSIQHFALDLFNNVYVLDSANNSIQVFAVNETQTGVTVERVATVPLEPRPQYRNLKVMAVSTDGVLVATGKNDNNLVIYR